MRTQPSKRIRETPATRYVLQAPVRYRGADGRWCSGTTESISRCDLLLRVERPLPPNTAIEMEVELPAVCGEEPARVICRGKIVSVSAGDPSTIVAATIARYRFGRTISVESRVVRGEPVARVSWGDLNVGAASEAASVTPAPSSIAIRLGKSQRRMCATRS